MIKQPFYGLFLCGINKRYADVGTACVGIEGINTVIRLLTDDVCILWCELDGPWKFKARAKLMRALPLLYMYYITE